VISEGLARKLGGQSVLGRMIEFSEGPPGEKLLLLTQMRELNCVRTEILSAKNGLMEFDLPDEAIFTLVGETMHP
jgi:hypothetical protein